MPNRPNPQSEPENEPEPGSPRVNPEPEATIKYEPIPELEKAMNAWLWAWDVHWIGFGTIFTVIAFVSLVTGICTRRSNNLVIWKFRLAVCFLLTVFASSRGLWLFLYPYELKANVSETPIFLLRLLYSLGFPSLSTGFMLVHAAFLDVSKISMKKIQSWCFILSVVMFNYCFVLAANVAMHFTPDSVIAGITCTSFFIVMSLVVASSVVYSGVKVIRKNRINQSTIERMNNGRNCASNPGRRTRKIAKVTSATAALAMLSSGLYLYMLINFIQVTMFKQDSPRPWPWLSVQTITRVVEVGMAVLMGYTISHKETRTTSNRWKFLRRVFKINRQFSMGVSSTKNSRKSNDKMDEFEETVEESMDSITCCGNNFQKYEQPRLCANISEDVVRATLCSNNVSSTYTTEL